MTETAIAMGDYIFGLSPDLLGTLLKDRTKSIDGSTHNIFWATSDYEPLGKGYGYNDAIETELITGEHKDIVVSRILKEQDTQRFRVRDMAEVFTPSWICNKQNNLIDEAWFGRRHVFNQENTDNTWTTNHKKITFSKSRTWYDYVRDIRLEITCGEAPYLVSRYDTTTGEKIQIEDRIGILDRKLRVVSENTDNPKIWLKWARVAFQSVYGYEWQGDSLLIARENLLMTFIEYFRSKFGREPALRSMMCIADIISWNLWQMDGLKGVIPGSCGKRQTKSVFGEIEVEPCPGCRTGDINSHNGIYCLVKDWKKPFDEIKFIDLLKR